MRGSVLRHYSSAAFYACDNTVLLRMDEMPGENVGLQWCGYVYCLIDLPGCGFVGLWALDVSMVWVLLRWLCIYAVLYLYLRPHLCDIWS